MKERIKHLLNNPFEVQLTDVALLQDEIEKYPYFSTLRSLLLFGLKEFDHPSYQEELKKTSIYSPSRVALYHYLQKERQESTEVVEPEIHQTEMEETEEIVYLNDFNSVEIVDELPEEIVSEEILIPENESDEIEDSTLISKELSFNDWLKFSNSPKTNSDPSHETPSEKDLKYQLIDDFIEKSPKISPVKQQDSPSVPTKTETPEEYSDLMTETLAQIYTQQKKYDKALRAYKILRIKYPEKDEFFSEKIDEIIYLRDHK